MLSTVMLLTLHPLRVRTPIAWRFYPLQRRAWRGGTPSPQSRPWPDMTMRLDGDTRLMTPEPVICG